ncbi:MAG: isoaspartyl peptidase/L-asparaginase, partial [Roseiflexaceae bacterium]
SGSWAALGELDILMPISIIVHGGAWDILDDEVAEHQAGCRTALEAGWRVLDRGGAALDAVEAARARHADNFELITWLMIR